MVFRRGGVEFSTQKAGPSIALFSDGSDESVRRGNTGVEVCDDRLPDLLRSAAFVNDRQVFPIARLGRNAVEFSEVFGVGTLAGQKQRTILSENASDAVRKVLYWSRRRPARLSCGDEQSE